MSQDKDKEKKAAQYELLANKAAELINFAELDKAGESFKEVDRINANITGFDMNDEPVNLGATQHSAPLSNQVLMETEKHHQNPRWSDSNLSSHPDLIVSQQDKSDRIRTKYDQSENTQEKPSTSVKIQMLIKECDESKPGTKDAKQNDKLISTSGQDEKKINLPSIIGKSTPTTGKGQEITEDGRKKRNSSSSDIKLTVQTNQPEPPIPKGRQTSSTLSMSVASTNTHDEQGSLDQFDDAYKEADQYARVFEDNNSNVVTLPVPPDFLEGKLLSALQGLLSELLQKLEPTTRQTYVLSRMNNFFILEGSPIDPDHSGSSSSSHPDTLKAKEFDPTPINLALLEKMKQGIVLTKTKGLTTFLEFDTMGMIEQEVLEKLEDGWNLRQIYNHYFDSGSCNYNVDYLREAYNMNEFETIEEEIRTKYR